MCQFWASIEEMASSEHQKILLWHSEIFAAIAKFSQWYQKWNVAIIAKFREASEILYGSRKDKIANSQVSDKKKKRLFFIYFYFYKKNFKKNLHFFYFLNLFLYLKKKLSLKKIVFFLYITNFCIKKNVFIFIYFFILFYL